MYDFVVDPHPGNLLFCPNETLRNQILSNESLNSINSPVKNPINQKTVTSPDKVGGSIVPGLLDFGMCLR